MKVTGGALRGRAGALEGAPLGQLLEAMRTGQAAEAEAAWAECFSRYYERVWARVFYVVRTIYWLREPREEAADVTGQVFLGLREAVRNYRDQGKPEQWLMQVAVRTALRYRESITGKWSSGRSSGKKKESTPRGRSYVGIDDLVQEIAEVVDHAEADERFDLRRRLESWREDDEKKKYLPFIDLFLEGYGHDEIAERLGITSGTSRTWLWKIRQHLSEGLEDEMTRDDHEVSGRDAAEAPVISILDRLDSHPGDEVLLLLAEWEFDAEETVRAHAHLQGCPRCATLVAGQRFGQAVLALASHPPAGDFGQIQERWRSGERVLLAPPGRADAAPDDLREVSGRDADADADGRADEREDR